MATAETELAVPSASEELTIAKSTEIRNTGPLAYLLDTQLFNHLWRVASAYSRSHLVPDHFKGKPDDCFVACQLALRLEVDPFMLMQGMYVVHGRPGMEAKLAIALCNARGPFSDRIKWRFAGEGMARSCTAYAHDKLTGDVCEQVVTMQMAKAEGWIAKNGSKWQTLPDLMLQYRSAMFLIRLNCPEVLMGLQTADELIEIEPHVIPAHSLPGPVTAADLTRHAAPSAEGKAEPPAAANGNGETSGTAEADPATSAEPLAWEPAESPADLDREVLFREYIELAGILSDDQHLIDLGEKARVTSTLLPADKQAIASAIIRRRQQIASPGKAKAAVRK